jgi:SAM-dependent methyltransferase
VSLATLREIVGRLQLSSSALAAVAAALAARLGETETESAPDPVVHVHVASVVDALGASASIASASRAELRPLLAEIRTMFLTDARLVGASAPPGWSHRDGEILIAAGDVSAAFPDRFEKAIVPELDDLARRLAAPGASFLDVGVGVAALSIEMARRWPSLRVVGIDPLEPALALARERVRAAGLDHRIELRQQAGEQLTDEEAFDLAWIPSLFVPESAVPAILERVHRALRPGGWLLFPMWRADGDGLAGSLARLRIAMFGGLPATQPGVEQLLRRHGFIDVRSTPAPPPALSALAVGRRPLPPR